VSGAKTDAPAPIGQEAQPAADRRAFKAAEAVRTSPPVGGFFSEQGGSRRRPN